MNIRQATELVRAQGSLQDAVGELACEHGVEWLTGVLNRLDVDRITDASHADLLSVLAETSLPRPARATEADELVNSKRSKQLNRMGALVRERGLAWGMALLDRLGVDSFLDVPTADLKKIK